MASSHAAEWSFAMESRVHGYHVYQCTWIPSHGEVVVGERGSSVTGLGGREGKAERS